MERSTPNPDLYYELRESWSLDRFYFEVNEVLNEVESTNDLQKTITKIRSFLNSVNEGVKSGVFDKEMFRAVAPSLFAEMNLEGIAADSPAKEESKASDTGKIRVN